MEVLCEILCRCGSWIHLRCNAGEPCHSAGTAWNPQKGRLRSVRDEVLQGEAGAKLFHVSSLHRLNLASFLELDTCHMSSSCVVACWFLTLFSPMFFMQIFMFSLVFWFWCGEIRFCQAHGKWGWCGGAGGWSINGLSGHGLPRLTTGAKGQWRNIFLYNFSIFLYIMVGRDLTLCTSRSI